MAGPKPNNVSGITRPTARAAVGMDLASRMNANQQQERHQQATSWQEAARAGQEKKAFLESETRSYTRAAKTEKDDFMDTQRQMIETAAQLSPEATDTEESSQEQPSSERAMRQIPSEEARAAEEQEAQAIAEEQAQQEEQMQRAQQFQEIQQLDAQEQGQETNQQEQAYNLIQQTKKEWQNIRQFSEAASGVGILLLILELNAQTITTLLNIKIRGLQKASRPRMIATGCIDCAACFGQIAMWLPLIIVVLITLWAMENPLQAFITYVRLKFGL